MNKETTPAKDSWPGQKPESTVSPTTYLQKQLDTTSLQNKEIRIPQGAAPIVKSIVAKRIVEIKLQVETEAGQLVFPGSLADELVYTKGGWPA